MGYLSGYTLVTGVDRMELLEYGVMSYPPSKNRHAVELFLSGSRVLIAFQCVCAYCVCMCMCAQTNAPSPIEPRTSQDIIKTQPPILCLTSPSASWRKLACNGCAALFQGSQSWEGQSLWQQVGGDLREQKNSTTLWLCQNS